MLSPVKRVTVSNYTNAGGCYDEGRRVGLYAGRNHDRGRNSGGVGCACRAARCCTDEARVVAAQQDISSVLQALKLYRIDNSRYPSNEQGLSALVTQPTIEPLVQNWKSYLDRLPSDPWGRTYLYLSPGVHGEIDVFSLGADGNPGGEGADADIGSWQL